MGVTHDGGEQFDASWDRGDPLEFRLGVGMVIQGWDEGITGMKVGGRRRLTIPAHKAYGERGAGGVIKPGATLVFVVDLVGVQVTDAALSGLESRRRRGTGEAMTPPRPDAATDDDDHPERRRHRRSGREAQQRRERRGPGGGAGVGRRIDRHRHRRRPRQPRHRARQARSAD